MKKNVLSVALFAISLLSLGSCGNKQKTAELSGAGATFPLPYYNESFKTYQSETGVKVSYGGIGSGGGVRNLTDQIVDFAGSDAFLKDEEMKKMPAVVHVPTCMGAVVLAYKLKRVKDLKLTGSLVADAVRPNRGDVVAAGTAETSCAEFSIRGGGIAFDTAIAQMRRETAARGES